MKKSFLLLPLVAAFTLTACTSNNSAEVSESSSDTLPNGGTWQPADIQPTSMPNGMNQPISQPSYTPAPVTAKPVATAPSYNNNASYGSSDNIGNCQVVRDAPLPLARKIRSISFLSLQVNPQLRLPH